MSTADRVNIKSLIEKILDELKIKPHNRGVKMDFHGHVTVEFIDDNLCRRSTKIRSEEFRSPFGREQRIRHIVASARMFK